MDIIPVALIQSIKTAKISPFIQNGVFCKVEEPATASSCFPSIMLIVV